MAEDHFSPAEDLERIDVDRLDHAKNSLDIAMYAFTDRYLAEELKRLAGRGAKIRIYRDQEQYEQEQRTATKHENDSTTSMLSGRTERADPGKRPSRTHAPEGLRGGRGAIARRQR